MRIVKPRLDRSKNGNIGRSLFYGQKASAGFRGFGSPRLGRTSWLTLIQLAFLTARLNRV
jgi:hypothetical protein